VSLRRELNLPRGIVPTQLVPVNATADAINIRELEKLAPEPAVMYAANDWGQDAYALDMLGKITLFPERLSLRVGAQVMLLKNHANLKLWNGSRGLVIGFFNNKNTVSRQYDVIDTCPRASAKYDLLPIVRFSTGQEVVIGYDAFELEGAGKNKIRGSRQQLPLRLSWAITIHKSQGMSLDFLMVDASRSFEAGQAYVALSRARSLEGLQVMSFDPRKCWCDTKVVEFYRNGMTKLTEAECDALKLTKPERGKSRKRKSTDWIRKPEDDIDTWLAEGCAADENKHAPPGKDVMSVMASILAASKKNAPAADSKREESIVETKALFDNSSPPRVPSYSALYAFRSNKADNPPL
jgi:hypothetical protein